MIKSKIAFKLSLNFAAALILFSLIIGGIFLALFKNYTVEIHKLQLQKYAEAIADTLSGEQKHGMRGMMSGAYIHFISESTDVNVWIVDENLNVITPSTGHMMGHQGHDMMRGHYNVAQLPPNAGQVIQNVFKNETVFSEDFSDVLSQLTLTVGVPVRHADGSVWGAVLVHAPVEGMNKAVAQGLIILGISILVALGLVFALSLALAYFFTKPLNIMKDVALQLAQGNYKAACHIRQNDEIGDLADTLDILAGRLDEASKESGKLEQLRKDLVSNISHELRTPVTVIRGSLEALCDHVVTDPQKVAEYHEQMLIEAKFLQRLIGDLLDLSRLQNPDFVIEKQQVRLDEVLSDVCRSARQIARQQGVVVHSDIARDTVRLWGDYGRLRQMFLIVIDNAVKFSPAGGQVEMTAGEQTITIRDHGPGIAQEHLPHIFDRFYKTHGEDNKTGTGLGLAIAKQIAMRHHIELSVRNAPGGGAVFCFIIQEPLAKDVPVL
jgi:signal transduction histidine kinase